MTPIAMWRPRIKPEHAAYRTMGGNVRIGGVIYGIGSEIEDPDGWIWTLSEAMDGTRKPRAVITEVLRRHPKVTDAEVTQALQQLIEAGFVEDAGAPPPSGLSEREQERYRRGAALLRWMDLTPRESTWDVQLRLRRARVLLCGVGGTGGVAAQGLVASGVGHLHCVDPDVVELSNLNRQLIYREDDIGRFKIDAAVDHLRSLNSDVVVTGERREIRDAGDLAALLAAPASPPDAGSQAAESPPAQGYDLLVLCADRPPVIRRWANQVCLARKVPWVDGGYRGPLATAGMYVPGDGPCWECLHSGAESPDLCPAQDVDDERLSPRVPWNPVNAVSAGISGNLVTHAALALLTGVPPLQPGVRFGVNLMVPGDPVLQQSPRLKDCPACGKAP